MAKTNPDGNLTKNAIKLGVSHLPHSILMPRKQITPRKQIREEITIV
jgi:hypothetical protein